MQLKRFFLDVGERVLMVEDVLTTGGTTRESIASIEEAGGRVHNQILVVVNRSGQVEMDGRQIVSLTAPEIPVWTPDECPLCKLGSEVFRPKGREEWTKLTGKY